MAQYDFQFRVELFSVFYLRKATCVQAAESRESQETQSV